MTTQRRLTEIDKNSAFRIDIILFASDIILVISRRKYIELIFN